MAAQSNGLMRYLRSVVKPFVLTRAHWFLPGPVPEWLRQASYLARFSRWFSERAVGAPHFDDRLELYAHALGEMDLDEPFDYLEFGVSKGVSLRWWSGMAGNAATRFYGFDTFEGLPEAYGNEPVGAFTAGGRTPDIDDERIEYVVGLFQDTLYDFLERFPGGRRKVLHLDADLYTATLFVLTRIAPLLDPGDILIFDELGSLRNPEHEFRAVEDFFLSFPVNYRVLGSSEYHTQVALVLEAPSVS